MYKICCNKISAVFIYVTESNGYLLPPCRFMNLKIKSYLHFGIFVNWNWNWNWNFRYMTTGHFNCHIYSKFVHAYKKHSSLGKKRPRFVQRSVVRFNLRNLMHTHSTHFVWLVEQHVIEVNQPNEMLFRNKRIICTLI